MGKGDFADRLHKNKIAFTTGFHSQISQSRNQDDSLAMGKGDIADRLHKNKIPFTTGFHSQISKSRFHQSNFVGV